MKIEIPERLYFRILQECNNNEINIEDYISGLFEKYLNLQTSYEKLTQKELDYFIQCLHFTIEEILLSQKDLAESEEGTEVDKKMVDILNVIFARATRDKTIINECIDIFYKK